MGCTAAPPLATTATQKILVIYTSDTLRLLPYFSKAFTHRLQRETSANVYQNSMITSAWLLASDDKSKTNNAETWVSIFCQKIKKDINKHNKTLARKTAFLAEREISFLLLNNGQELTNDTFAEFQFWLTVALIDTPKLAFGHAQAYQKYATIQLLNDLESQVSDSTLAKIKRISQRSFLKQKYVSILGSKKCFVFVNGERITTRVVHLPVALKNTLFASCPDGVYSEAFFPKQKTTLILKPVISSQIKDMPSLDALPKSLIAEDNADSLILIHWAQEGGYLDAVVVDTKTFLPQKKAHIPLRLQEDFDRAGDKLMAFLTGTDSFL